MSNNSLLLSNFADKFSIPKMFEKVDFIKNCSAGILLFTAVSGLLAIETYRKNIYNKKELINKINETNKINEAKLDELIESNKLIIKMLEKHDVILNKIIQHSFINCSSKNSPNGSLYSFSELSFYTEKEKHKNTSEAQCEKYIEDQEHS